MVLVEFNRFVLTIFMQTRSKRNYHVLLPLCSYRAVSHLPRLRHYTNFERGIPSTWLKCFTDGICDAYLDNFQWFTAVYAGLVAAAYCCLLINGFVGFQFAEDGTPLSLWVCRFGQCSFPMHTDHTLLLAASHIVPRHLWYRFLCLHCNLQAICRL